MPLVIDKTDDIEHRIRKLKREVLHERELRRAAETETREIQKKMKSSLSEKALNTFQEKGCSYALRGEFGEWQQRLGRIVYREEEISNLLEFFC